MMDLKFTLTLDRLISAPDDNDCSVAAAAFVTGCRMKEARAAFSLNGRGRNEPASVEMIAYSLQSMGYYAEPITIQEFIRDEKVDTKGKRLTFAAFAKLKKEGAYILLSRNHAAGCIDGDLYELDARNRIVIGLFKVKEAPTVQIDLGERVR